MLKLFGRRHCHLCEEMAQALRRRGVPFEEIDVDGAPDLKERYGRFVPERYQLGEVLWGLFSMAALVRTPEFLQAAA